MPPEFPSLSAGAGEPRQIMHLTIRQHSLTGVVVSQTDEAIVIATPERERLAIEPGMTARVELPRRDGLYTFTAAITGVQMMPMLVLILDRPKALRHIQRRLDARFPVALAARLVYVSHEHSINVACQATNVSRRGVELVVAEAPPTGVHVVVTLELLGGPCTAIARVMRVRPGSEATQRVGLAFVEISRADNEALQALMTGPERP